MILTNLREGDLFYMRYWQQGGDYRYREYECTCVFLGWRNQRHYPGEFEVSFRPRAGTSVFSHKQVAHAELLAAAEERRGHRGDHRVKLPTRTRTPPRSEHAHA